MRTTLLLVLGLVAATVTLVPGAHATTCAAPDVPCCLEAEGATGERARCGLCIAVGGFWDSRHNLCRIQ